MPNPLISVVLPVYDRQQQLTDCLDSLLAQTLRDFEVLLVVDGSPDSPERVAAAYELRDPRIRMLRLNAAVGIGRARNAGMARAVGEYLLFLDSDHLLDPDALGVLAERLTGTGPVDVLLFGHDREHGGRVWPGGSGELLAGLGPGVFGPLDHPELLGAPAHAWDRLIRRGLVPPFPDGSHEEIPVVHQAMLTARRVAVLERTCVRIRRRHTVHPTGSPGSSHFDLFDQYQRSFELLDGTPESDPFRAPLFTRMVRHLLFVFDLAGCVDRAERPQFFQRAAEAYRTYQPDGYRRPGGREGVKFSLLANGAYPAFEVAKLGQIARTAVAGRR
ncbi:glycosyltransferase family 2 protein [Kitasatospora sp. NPDC096147]|uniref:glycosyltransferase family 2 protein n=1 Tax=Kitasatospora sp. NPDC096147 TaxID=3364093 RepID=UPI00381F580F